MFSLPELTIESIHQNYSSSCCGSSHRNNVPNPIHTAFHASNFHTYYKTPKEISFRNLNKIPKKMSGMGLKPLSCTPYTKPSDGRWS